MHFRKQTKQSASFGDNCSHGLSLTVHDGNQMDIRIVHAPEIFRNNASFALSFTAFREISASKNESCAATEFDCEDSTCIDLYLRCDGWANCRTRKDEDYLTTCRSRPIGAVESFIIRHQEYLQVVVMLIVFALVIGAAFGVYWGVNKICRSQK